MIPNEQLLLDIISLLFALAVGLPQAVIAFKANRPKNLRALAMLLGICGLFCGASAFVHLLRGPDLARVMLLGLSVGAGLGWLLLLLSLARHNTTM